MFYYTYIQAYIFLFFPTNQHKLRFFASIILFYQNHAGKDAWSKLKWWKFDKLINIDKNSTSKKIAIKNERC